MIAMYEGKTTTDMSKPIICPKCERGRLANIPEWSEAVLTRRGKPPPGNKGEGVQVKCPTCRTLWTLTIE